MPAPSPTTATPSFQHRAEYFFFRRFRASILNRPHEEVEAFGARLGRWGHRLVVGARKLALRNLERVFPDLPMAERQRIVGACFEHFGSHYCELLSLERFGPDEAQDYFEIEGWQHVEALQERGEAFFLHTGHYGHSEMALYPFAARLQPFHAVARPPNNPLVNRDVMELRARLGVSIIEKRGAALKIRSAHRAGGTVAMIIDQHVRPSAGIRVPFLGLEAWTSPVLAMLALRHRAAIVPFTCLPTDRPGHYRIEIRPPFRGSDLGLEGSGDEAQAALTRRILEEVEHDIRQRPELWLWMHRRWRD